MAIGNLVIGNEARGPRSALSELLLAWGRDAATGQPRYILELTDKERGAKCGCECPSCGRPLTAVNAAKSATEIELRPHFRHPTAGATRNECLILAARAAVLRNLQDDGWLDLPRRRMSGRAIGLSGEHYDAWVEAPPERVRIASIDFHDRAFALLTLGDGRNVRVQLVGTGGDGAPDLDESGLPRPTIYLTTDDPSVAAMDPSEIRGRLTLISDGIGWCSHWSDAQLRADADAAARARAAMYLDADQPELDLPADMEPALKWQTVLHYEVKNILAEAGEVMAPAIERTIELAAPDGRVLRETVYQDAEMLELTHARLEHRFGSVVPDVMCEGWASGGIWLMPLLIEVTVTNHIDEERLARIQSTQAYALEIDLSRTGGRVTRDELRALVLDEIAIKRWLYFPNFESSVADALAKLQRQVDEELADLEDAANRAAQRRNLVLAMPLEAVAQEYLSNVTSLLELENEDSPATLAADSPELAARERVADSADKLALRGFPEAADSNLIAWHGILARLLSIRLDRGVGYGDPTAPFDGHDVLNAIKQSRGVQRSNFSIYLIAARVFKPKFTDEQRDRFEAWVREVRESIKRGEPTYLRDPVYDGLLSVLFPEMADALAKDFGKRRAASGGAQRRERASMDTPIRSKAAYLEKQPKAAAMQVRLLDTPPDSFWLKGRDLDAWRRANPEAARWFGGVA
jgi:hypothetical protein